MNFSVVCSGIALLMLVGHAQVESAECPKATKDELKAIVETCFPNEGARHEPGQSPPPTLSPEDVLQGFRCLAREVPNKTNLRDLFSTCGTISESATASEAETYMACVGTQLNSVGCMPKEHEHHN